MVHAGSQGKDDIIWFVKQYLSGPSNDPKDPMASPLFAKDFSGLPPSLIITAEVPLHFCSAINCFKTNCFEQQYGNLILWVVKLERLHQCMYV